MGGQAMRAPVLAALFLVVTMATLAIPGSANFVGEFYILNGAFQSKIAFAFVAAVGIVLAAFYALRLYQRTMHNRLPAGAESREIAAADGIVLAPLVACIVGLALWPGLVLERGEASVEESVAAVTAEPAPGALEPGQISSGPRAESAAVRVGGEGWTGYAPLGAGARR
jgi:NADH-quinone oxidoreductase subunit M